MVLCQSQLTAMTHVSVCLSVYSPAAQTSVTRRYIPAEVRSEALVEVVHRAPVQVVVVVVADHHGVYRGQLETDGDSERGLCMGHSKARMSPRPAMNLCYTGYLQYSIV